MSSPSVSVIIPFFNGSRWIERSLESVVSQTYPAREILVVDDGSSPAESLFLDELQSRYPIEVITMSNSGQSAARNLGVAKASSDFICLLDQDDYFLPEHIMTLMDLVDSTDDSFAFSYGDLVRVSESGETLAKTCVNVNFQHPLTKIDEMLRHSMHILPSATLIKKSAFISIGGFDESLQGYEDDDLFLRFFLAGYSNRFTPEPVSAWTVNLTSTSFTEAMARSRFLYFKKLISVFPEESKDSAEIFAKFLFARFAYKIAEDVIQSVLSRDEYISECVERLKYVREIVFTSREIRSATRIGFLATTALLVLWNPRKLRYLLLAILRIGPILRVLRIDLLDQFLARHSSSKKIVT